MPRLLLIAIPGTAVLTVHAQLKLPDEKATESKHVHDPHGLEA